MPTSFVLVHGAFGSPAELAPVVPYLEARGHRVVNVDLPCERAESTLEDYAAAVVRAMEGTSRPRILVAHSAGGATIPLVASLLPVDRLVFAAAIVPEPGLSISEVVGPDVAVTIAAVTIDNGDGTRSFNLDLLASLAPPEERDAYLEFLTRTQRSQGWLAINQPWPGAGIPEIPRDYILCTDDQIIPPDRQRAFAAKLGVSPIEIASVHAVFTFMPRELADLLVSLAG
ncbi:alpha/beta hydrolase [Defluviimonas sp. D31]|uniref:alpha/beta hydrolase n=1 Tax=Defluviimonas sp. D31 TaxID=3083253 RepID=UPI00296FC105|nr:alpha/beta hydrolase [Defluviimonas sp. D31]MDW4548146.1 alpha/beta hydrolase [Defluviimonas sp. D31]